MKVNLTIEMELNTNEIKYLRKYFENNMDRSVHRVFTQMTYENNKLTNLRNPLFDCAMDLVEKQIIIEDSIGNLKLSKIGRIIMDKISRNKRIDLILKNNDNGNT